MTILFISYWDMKDPLTAATVYPSLQTLQSFDFVDKIIFVNTERGEPTEFSPNYAIRKIEYRPIFSKNFKIRFLTKLIDFIRFPWLLRRITSVHKIDFILARGASAGALAYLLFKKTDIPFLVESFEPHAEYMLESKVWRNYDFRYVLQKKWEHKQKQFAAGLMPVTYNYQNQLLKESIAPSRIKVVPCGVDAKLFEFNNADRESLREKLGVGPGMVVGLYAGKYDGLYLAEEAFELYKICFDQIINFHLIILSPNIYHDWIKEQIQKTRLPAERVFLRSVSHREVGKYCSASDFAFATYKPGKSKAYLSPVKIGEYWASGLPVLLTNGIGDETLIIKNGVGGVLFDAEGINQDALTEIIAKLMALVKTPGIRDHIARMGLELRSFDKLKKAYEYFLMGR